MNIKFASIIAAIFLSLMSVNFAVGQPIYQQPVAPEYSGGIGDLITGMINRVTNMVSSITDTCGDINDALPYSYVPITSLMDIFLSEPSYYFRYMFIIFLATSIFELILSLIIPILGPILFLLFYPFLLFEVNLLFGLVLTFLKVYNQGRRQAEWYALW